MQSKEPPPAALTPAPALAASVPAPAPVWDAIVVGAGFAGLAGARAAAQRGLRVLVLERLQGPGARVRTTGLLCPDSLDLLAPSAQLLAPRLDALRLCGPGLGRGVRVERAGAGFTPTDTAGLLRELASRAAAAGAVLRFGTTVQGVQETAGGGVEVLAGGERLRAWRLLGADGARSTVARGRGLRPPGKLLLGVERHFEPSRFGELPSDEALLLLHGGWAPGYAVWAVPGFDGCLQVGLLARPGAGVSPARALDAASELLERRRGVRLGPPKELRAGWVPVGGVTRRARTQRVVLAGDAAGQVSELTAGGIGRAVAAGSSLGSRLAADPAHWDDALEDAAAGCGGVRRPLRRVLDLVSRPGLDRLCASAAALPPVPALIAELAFRRHRLGSVSPRLV
jgi:flavin-dependent dehydrogenase